MRKKFGDDRRTTIIGEEPKTEESKELSFPEYVVIGEDNIMYRSSNLDDLRKGCKLGKTEPRYWVYSDGLQVVCFSKDGTVSDEWLFDSNGLFKFDPNKDYVLTISRNGIGKKTPTSEYKKLQRLCKVKEGDELLFAFSVNEEDNIIVRTTGNKVCRIKVSDVKNSGRLTIGSKIIGIPITHACVTNTCFYTLNADNQIKKCEIDELTKTTVSLNDGCVHIGSCDPHSTYWSRGKFTQLDWSKISIKSRTSDGAKIASSEIRVC